MPKALSIHNLPGEVERRQKHAAGVKERRTLKARKEKGGLAFKNKKFKTLTQAQKDKLLKAIAIQLGLLDDDDEEEDDEDDEWLAHQRQRFLGTLNSKPES